MNSPRKNVSTTSNTADILNPNFTNALRACVLLRIILTEQDREIAGPGWCVCADGLGDHQRAMETAQHRDRLAKNQPAEITMFQTSEVQEILR